MTKVSTVPFNTIQKLKNMTTPKGKVANRFAEGLINEGYKNIYQRPLKFEKIAISGENANGDTKTFILSYLGYMTKTNKTTPITAHTAIREIDKAHFNQFNSEIFGIKKIQRLVNNHIFDSKEIKRGWGT